MGRILILSFLFAAANAFAAQPGNAPVVCIGAPGQQTQSLCIPLTQLSTTPQQIFSIYGYWAAANQVAHFYKNGVAYQVTTGKTAYCVDITGTSSSAPSGTQLMSATNNFTDGAGSVTGYVSQCNTSIGNNCMWVGSSSSYVPAGAPGTYQFSSLTYPGFATVSSVSYSLHMDCFEQ